MIIFLPQSWVFQLEKSQCLLFGLWVVSCWGMLGILVNKSFIIVIVWPDFFLQLDGITSVHCYLFLGLLPKIASNFHREVAGLLMVFNAEIQLLYNSPTSEIFGSGGPVVGLLLSIRDKCGCFMVYQLFILSLIFCQAVAGNLEHCHNGLKQCFSTCGLYNFQNSPASL